MVNKISNTWSAEKRFFGVGRGHKNSFQRLEKLIEILDLSHKLVSVLSLKKLTRMHDECQRSYEKDREYLMTIEIPLNSSHSWI